MFTCFKSVCAFFPNPENKVLSGQSISFFPNFSPKFVHVQTPTTPNPFPLPRVTHASFSQNHSVERAGSRECGECANAPGTELMSWSARGVYANPAKGPVQARTGAVSGRLEPGERRARLDGSFYSFRMLYMFFRSAVPPALKTWFLFSHVIYAESTSTWSTRQVSVGCGEEHRERR